MRAVVVYESMYGNTHLIAEAIGAGLHDVGEVAVVPVGGATEAMRAGVDLLVVGGPTHMHAMSREVTRTGAVEAARKPANPLELDPDAEGVGLREWFDATDALTTKAAAFDTRMSGPPAFTGRASKGIAKRLHKHGCELVAEPESFLVTKQDRLVDHEEQRAREWGAQLAVALAPATT